jgi:hypothetical protein
LGRLQYVTLLKTINDMTRSWDIQQQRLLDLQRDQARMRQEDYERERERASRDSSHHLIEQVYSLSINTPLIGCLIPLQWLPLL